MRLFDNRAILGDIRPTGLEMEEFFALLSGVEGECPYSKNDMHGCAQFIIRVSPKSFVGYARLS